VAASCLESALLQEARGCLKVIRSQQDEGTVGTIKAQSALEEDFYLSSSDKLVFLMREFKAELHPDRIATQANPLLVAKLAVAEVAKFDFPRLKLADVAAGLGEVSDEVLTEKMITLAKVSVTRKYGDDPEPRSSFGTGGGHRDSDDEAVKERYVKSPSLLQLACNTVEVLRLRHDLIQIVHETEVLSRVYTEQLRRTGKGAWKLVGRDPIPFETQTISKDSMNLVDHNDGSKLELDLAALEFDATVTACLDFRSESCVKALMTDLGLEELRAVVHYQLMQKQLLTVGVLRNQALMDGPVQGLVELELLNRRPHAVTVPGAMLRLQDVLSRAVDGTHVEHAKKEESRFSASLSKAVGEHMYSIAARKARHRPMVQKKYNQLL